MGITSELITPIGVLREKQEHCWLRKELLGEEPKREGGVQALVLGKKKDQRLGSYEESTHG